MTPPAQPAAGRILFTVAGIPFTVTANSWQFVPPKLVIGVVVALFALPDEPFMMRVLWGLIFGVLLLVSLCLHIFGHILSSKMVTPPMTEAHISPVLIQTLYHADRVDVPGRVHLVRSLGGPVMTLIIGTVALLLWQRTGAYVLAFAAGANFVLLAFIMLPIKTVDGEVIWREVRRGLTGKKGI